MSEELNRYRIPEEIRKQILSSLKEEISRTGSVPYAEIGGRVLRNLQVNWSDYAGTAGKLSEWLRLYFPELESTPDNRGVKLKAAVPGVSARAPVTQEVRNLVAAAIEETLGENDTALLSDLGWSLVAKGIDRKKYTNEGLGDWVKGLFPGIQKSADGLRFSRGSTEPVPVPAPTPVPTPAPAHPQPSYPPAELTLSQVDLDENVRQMHTLAYMGWWNNNIRVLKRYTGHTGTDTRIWSGIVAQQMTDVLLGRRQAILGTPVEETNCAAFYSGTDTQDGKPIYCVMTPNKDGRAQPMMLLDFCWPGNEENAALGDWLTDCLADQISQQPARCREEILQLEDLCGQLEQLREQLTAQLEQALDCLRTWAELPMDRIPGLEQYNETWKQVRALCSAAEAPQTLTCPREIRDWCAQQNQYAAVLKQLTQGFGLLAEDLAGILRGFGIPQPDLTRDQEAMRLACEQYSNHPDTAPLQAVLLPYQQLQVVMDGPKPGQNMQELFAVTGQLDQHFGIVSMMLYGVLHRPELQALVREYADRLQYLQTQFSALDRMNQAPAAPSQQKPPLPDPQVLLDAVCSGEVMSLWTACGGENQLETLILEDRLPEALSFACDRQAMLETGFDEETRQDICSRLADGQNLPEGYTLYHIALRLNRVLGIQNATAERYFLMGMFADRADCTTELLNIYRQTGQQAKFVALWEQFGSAARYSAENYRYYIRYLQENLPEQVQAYLDSHVFLYHLPAYSQLLGDASCAGAEVLPANELEQALMADDHQQVLTLLSDLSALEEMGYSPEQITQISQAAISESVPGGTAPYPTGMRIYQYQSNLHQLAERHLWEGLARTPSAEISNKLVRLLANEGRWQECIRLYSCYASYSGISNDSRQAYLMAMLQAEPVKIQQDIRGNLQGFLALVHQNAQAAAAVEAYRASSSEAFRAFYESLHRIIQVLAEDYPRSVLLHDRSLRDLVTQPALLADLELDDRQLESAKTMYQSGNYPQGPDAESVAKRAYAFLGSYHGIAEQLARFCLPAKSALALLWNIACDNADTQEQHLLLQNHPALRDIYPHAYSQYLFHTDQYDLFLAWLDGYQNTDDTESAIELLPEEALQQPIALLRQHPQAEITVPILSDPLTPELTGYLAQLTAALVAADRPDDVASLLLDNFELLLGSCSSENLEQVMTAGGSLSLSAAETIQARAMADGAFKTALYYHNTLGAGDIAEQAEAYYQTFLNQCEQGSLEEQLLRMDEMAKLYPGRHQDLQNRMYRMHVYDLLKTEPYTKEVQTKLAEALEECALDTEDIRSLIGDVQASVYAGGDGVVQSIAKLTDRDDLMIDGLVYLHRTAVSASKKSGIPEVLYRNLCQRYAAVLDRDCFPEELSDEAEMLCRRIILGNSKRYDVAFCLYRIEMRLGHHSRAECVLRHLSMQPTNELGALYAVVEAAAEDFWADKVPSMLHTFVEYVQNHTPEEILSYCDFSKIFIHTSDEDWTIVHEHIQNMRQQRRADSASVREYSPCTQTEGESLVKVLCTAPDKADYWWACTMLPGLSQAARAKLLFICGKKNPNMYKECAQFCVESEQDTMLLQVLQEWVNSPSPGPKNCRTYLADILVKEPGFFARWTRDEDTRMLLDILEQLCCDIREDLENLLSNVAHTALNTISSIAVAIGSPEAVELLERYLSVPLLTRNTEVGVATVLRLLLANRSQLAGNLLDGLFHSTAPIACRLLIEQLHALTPEALAEQIGSYEHRLLWGMLLPDGNRPAAQDIYQFVMNIIRKNRIQEGANVLNMLLDIFPGDYACCDALFTLCKFEIENQIPLLHKALCGLVRGSSTGSSYFRRNYLWNAKLLAGLNAVIKARRLEQTVQQFHTGYDFNQEAGRYCLVNQSAITGDDVKNINSIQRSLTHDLQNLHAEVLEWKCRGILCWITGNWTEFLYTAWQNKADDEDVSQVRESLQFGSVHSDQDSVGFCRSLLLVAARLERSQRIPFLQWVWLALTGENLIPRKGDFKLSGKLRQTAMAFDLITADVPEKIGDLSLDIPLDEYSLMSLIFAENITPCIGKDTELLYNRLWLLGAVADYAPMILFQYFNPAQAAFREGDDKTAAAYYEAMHRLLERGLSRGLRQETMELKTYSFNKELYEAYSRISRLKAGDSKIIAKLSSPKFHVWSCVNMIVALICSPRGNEALQMAESFSDANRMLCRSILRIIDPAYPDQRKLDLLQNYPHGLEKAFLAYIMRSGIFSSNAFSPFFFKDSAMSMKAKSIFMNLAKQYYKFFDLTNAVNPRPRHYLLTNFPQINPVSYKQLPISQSAAVQIPDQAAQLPDAPSLQPPVQEAVLPGFARALTPLDQPDRLEPLQEEYDQLPHFQRYYQDRLERSEQIYRIHLSIDKQPMAMLPSLIRFGLDYYDHLDLDNPEEFSLAYRSITELVVYADSLRAAAGGADSVKLVSILKPLETAVENSIIYTLLDKGHLSIQSLVSQFAQDRKAFGIMQSMVQQDEFRKEALATIYTALDLLAESYSVNSSNSIVLRNALNRAKGLIGGINYGAWQSLKNKLQGMIQNEVNSIDRRPILDLEIQNRGVNPEEDYLYGEIRNEGMESATDITLQVAYEDSSSDRLRLAQLAPNEHVAFKIRYSAPEGAMSLRYTINWSYVFNGQTYIQPIKEDTLDISQLPDPTFPMNQYETQTITDFYEDENGVLGNPDFFGRERETEELRNLFRSGRFPSYNNAIVYGIRRAGKTTLLNYVQAYVTLHCSDAIIVKVDCLINTGTRLVQSLFIDHVLSAIQSRYPQYTETESWQRLVEKWTLSAEAADRDPSSLELFYQELKRVTDKGLILMLDEVDNFFTSVEQQTSLDNYLFQVLSNMLCSASCQQAVHFIFCGSKYLLRYRNGDGGLSQLFQRFGSNIIEVGLIPKSEMQRMIRKPYEAYPEVDITDEAIDWIWEYTQGLVWHVKLLANMVLRHVRENRRSVVYPVDVKDNIHSLVQKAYCEQFFDGINGKEKDKRERMVIDAMQSMASLRTSYVPKGILQQLLTSEGLPPEYRMTMDQLENALDNLTKLKLVTYSESNQGYRFPVDLYRLYFRSQREFPFVFKKVAAPEQTFLHI